VFYQLIELGYAVVFIIFALKLIKALSDKYDR